MAAGCEQRLSPTLSLKDGRQVVVRSATEDDLDTMSQIAYNAFSAFNTAKGLTVLPPDGHDFFKGLFGMTLGSGCPMLVACDGSNGDCLGSVVCDNRGEHCCGIGPITVDPTHQGRGIGRILMEAVMDHVTSAQSKPVTFRLTQSATNAASFCLYASLGFNACGNLLEFHGLPSPSNEHTTGSSHVSAMELRRATVKDVAGCDELFREAHGGGMGRRNEIHDAVIHSDAVHGWSVYVLTDNKDGSIVAYTTGLHVFGYTVGRDEAAFKQLLEMLSVELVESMRDQCDIYIDPVRYPDLVRWMLAARMKVEMQHTMMSTGCYTGPVTPFVYCPTIDY